jgi:hypothetical protein
MNRVTRIVGRPRGVDAKQRTRNANPAHHDAGPRGRRSERGSSLILALVYIVSISLIVGALADWAMNSLNNTTHFQNASSLDNSISGATEIAIQSMRYYPQYPATQTNYANCWTPPTGALVSYTTINTDVVAVWCTTVENLKSPNTRVVTFIACAETAAIVASAGSLVTAESNCQTTPTLKAVVTFDDYPSGGGGLLVQTCSGGPGICGFAATTNQWTWA